MSSFGSLAGDEGSEGLGRRSFGRAAVIAGLQVKRLQTVIRSDGVLSRQKADMIKHAADERYLFISHQLFCYYREIL